MIFLVAVASPIRQMAIGPPFLRRKLKQRTKMARKKGPPEIPPADARVVPSIVTIDPKI